MLNEAICLTQQLSLAENIYFCSLYNQDIRNFCETMWYSVVDVTHRALYG